MTADGRAAESVGRDADPTAASLHVLPRDAVVNVAGLTKRYGDLIAVDELTFWLRAGTARIESIRYLLSLFPYAGKESAAVDLAPDPSIVSRYHRAAANQD